MKRVVGISDSLGLSTIGSLGWSSSLIYSQRFNPLSKDEIRWKSSPRGTFSVKSIYDTLMGKGQQLVPLKMM